MRLCTPLCVYWNVASIDCLKLFLLRLTFAAFTHTFSYWNVASIPVISENEARESLTEYCDKKCCYGTGAARRMTIGTMQSTSAFHVWRLLSFDTQTLWCLPRLRFVFRSGALLIYGIFCVICPAYSGVSICFFGKDRTWLHHLYLLLWLQTCDITFRTVPLRHYFYSVTLCSACVTIINKAYSNVRSVYVKLLLVTIQHRNEVCSTSHLLGTMIRTTSRSTFAFNLFLCF